MSLRDKIRNIKCGGYYSESPAEVEAYAQGHNEACETAANLAILLEEENKHLRQLLKKAYDELAGLPKSLGYEFTHLRELEAALNLYYSQKELNK